MRDERIYNRAALISSGMDADLLDSLEVVRPVSSQDGRFQLIYRNSGVHLLAPSCSFFNRSNEENWYIWTGSDTDEGAIYIGETDFHSMACLAGYVRDSEKSRHEEELERLRAEHALAISTINDLRNAVAALVGSQSATQRDEPVPSDSNPLDRIKATRSRESSRGNGPTPLDVELSD